MANLERGIRTWGTFSIHRGLCAPRPGVWLWYISDVMSPAAKATRKTTSKKAHHCSPPNSPANPHFNSYTATHPGRCAYMEDRLYGPHFWPRDRLPAGLPPTAETALDPLQTPTEVAATRRDTRDPQRNRLRHRNHLFLWRKSDRNTWCLSLD